ncbi:methylmalonyl-CoA carboxyltransferase 12S subunit [Alternaria alternata]|nr:methylmalonyl-CoA carboxyltransferase 12S subunit [Alternaria alternata]
MGRWDHSTGTYTQGAWHGIADGMWWAEQGRGEGEHLGCIQDVNGAEGRLSEGKLRVERRASRANNIQGSWIAISGRTHRTLTSAWRRSWQAAIKTADRGFKHAQVLQACLENAWERFTSNDACNMRSTAPQQRLAKAVSH